MSAVVAKIVCLVVLAPQPTAVPTGPLEAGLACARSGDAAGAQRLWVAGLDAPADDAARAALLEHLVRLGRLHPPARAAVVARRDRLEASVRALPSEVDAIVRLVASNDALDEGARTADLYEEIAAARPDADLTTLGWCARPQLWRQRRYSAIRMTCPDPGARLAAATAAYADVRRRLAGSGLASAHAGVARVVRETLIDFEAMLATREREAAMDLAAELLAFAPTLGTRARLIVHAERAGASFAARSLRAEALPPGDEAAAARLEQALDAARREVRARGALDVDLPESTVVGEHGRGG